MIDHFPREILCSMQYSIISAGVRVGGRIPNVVKINELYPSTDISLCYAETSDKSVLRKMYKDELKESLHLIYLTYGEPIERHYNLTILCMRNENDFIDILAEFIEENLGIHCIDLNELFIKGHVGEFSLDRTKFRNILVDMRREFGRAMMKNMELTEGGRLNLLKSMNKKDKVKKLKSIGIDINDSDMKNLDLILQEAWVMD